MRHGSTISSVASFSSDEAGGVCVAGHNGNEWSAASAAAAAAASGGDAAAVAAAAAAASGGETRKFG